MKKIFPFSFISVLLISCGGNKQESTQNFELHGQLTNSNGETIYLEQMSADGVKTIDTAAIDAKGEFNFNANLPEKGFYRVKLSENNFATLVLDSTEKVTLSGNATDLGNTFTVEGSEDSKLLIQFTEDSKANYRRRDSLQKAFEMYINTMKMDSVKMDSMSNIIQAPFDSLLAKHNRYVIAFLEAHPTSFASLAAVQELNPDEFAPYFEKLDQAMMKQYPSSSYVKLFHQNVDAIKGLPIGSAAPEITMNTPEGKALSLSSFKGKTVLVDFWASWCGPCRAENPNVVKAYSKFKAKGFEILGVSLDKDKDKWIEAIKKDKLMWAQVSDLAFWNSTAAKLYKFQSIPTNYLLDAQGIIIAKNLRGEALENKLAQLLK